jgi:hypothetical protein
MLALAGFVSGRGFSRAAGNSKDGGFRSRCGRLRKRDLLGVTAAKQAAEK